MEKPSKKIISLPIFSVSEGEQLGNIKNLIIDPIAKQVLAFLIDQKGWFREHKIIPFNRVNSIGDHAITIDKSGTAEKPANLPQILRLLKNPVPLINAKVVTAAGKHLGQIEEFWFNAQGKITRLEIGGSLLEGLFKGKAALSAEEILTIGKDVIIVQEGAEDRLSSGDRYLQNTVKEIKTVTSKAWGNTVHTSQKLGKAIKTSIGKLIDEEEKLTGAAGKTSEDVENTNNLPVPEEIPPPEKEPETPVSTSEEELVINPETPETPEVKNTEEKI